MTMCRADVMLMNVFFTYIDTQVPGLCFLNFFYFGGGGGGGADISYNLIPMQVLRTNVFFFCFGQSLYNPTEVPSPGEPAWVC